MDNTSDLFKSGIRRAYNTMQPDSTNMSTDINTDRFVSMVDDLKTIKELPEQKGYSDYLKTPENPKGETDGLTHDLIKKIFMRIISDMEKEGDILKRETDDENTDKEETKEATGSSSSGGYTSPLFGKIKRKIKESSKNDSLSKEVKKLINLAHKDITRKKGSEYSPTVNEIQKWVDNYFSIDNGNKEETKEATTTSSSGQYDTPFPTKKRKDPLSIEGPNSIYTSRAVKDKNFPKLGGPDGKYVQVKDKCKKFPYCNQGDINALHIFEKDYVQEAIHNISNKTKLSENYIKTFLFENLKNITQK
jgi:Asp-tRNA(Asn)/Glu-tRNA(Gln) amidotransferase C subunit